MSFTNTNPTTLHQLVYLSNAVVINNLQFLVVYNSEKSLFFSHAALISISLWFFLRNLYSSIQSW